MCSIHIEQEWYFVTKIVLIYCEKKIVLVIENNFLFEAEGQEFSIFLRSLEQFIQTGKGQNNFWYYRMFFNLFLEIFRSQKIEKFNSNCKKLLGFRNLQKS